MCPSAIMFLFHCNGACGCCGALIVGIACIAFNWYLSNLIPRGSGGSRVNTNAVIPTASNNIIAIIISTGNTIPAARMMIPITSAMRKPMNHHPLLLISWKRRTVNAISRMKMINVISEFNSLSEPKIIDDNSDTIMNTSIIHQYSARLARPLKLNMFFPN